MRQSWEAPGKHEADKHAVQEDLLGLRHKHHPSRSASRARTRQEQEECRSRQAQELAAAAEDPRGPGPDTLIERRKRDGRNDGRRGSAAPEDAELGLADALPPMMGGNNKGRRGVGA